MVDQPAIFCDTVQSIAVHNGTVRILFVRLDVQGKPTPAIELLMPIGQVASLAKALAQLAK
jgi:hypothetical protein